MSTKIYVHNNGARTDIRRTRVRPGIDNDEIFRKVFKEEVDPIEVALKQETQLLKSKSNFFLPELAHKLTSHNPELRRKALTKIIQNLRTKSNSTYGNNINEMVKNAVNLFLRQRRYGMKHDYEEEGNVMTLLELLSSNESGAMEMVMMGVFIRELYNILYNVQAENQDQAAKILYNITNQPIDIVREFIRKNKPFSQLTKIFKRSTGILYYPKNLFLHLASLIELYPAVGVKFGFFDICFDRINNKLPGYYKENMRCFAALLKCKKGMDLFQKTGMMKILLNLITSQPEDLNAEYVLKCFNAALNLEEMKQECVSYLELPSVIKSIAKKTNNDNVQFTCFEIITKLYLIEPFDSIIYRDCMGWLKSMKSNGQVMNYLRNEFILFVAKRHQKHVYEEDC